MLFSSKISAALAIDPREKKIRFYSMNRTDRSGIIYDEQTFRPACFSAGFYQEFAAIAQSFLEKYTSVAGAPVTVILPDSAIFADLVVLPGMNRMAVRGALNTALNSAFKNRNELKINDTCLIQNKQTTKISLCGVRQEILTATRSALSGVRLSPQGFTFGANTTATAAADLNPKLRGGTYLLMDISQNETRVVYVLHGCAVAFGALPFGYAVMEKQRVAAEDMLFDHSVAELAVLNARERAKQKALTMMGGEGTVDAADAEAIAAAAQNTEAAKTEDAPKPEEPVKEDETPEEEDDDLIGADEDEEEEEDDTPLLFVEDMPSFQGGDLNKFRNWVQSRLKYPAIAQENNIQGKVTLSFVIEKDGTLTHIEVLQSPDRSLSEEASRILAQSPKWTPGKQRNIPVRVKYILPVDFVLHN